jgi:hypothetical protein
VLVHFKGMGCLSFADLFNVYLPHMYEHYQRVLDQLIEQDHTLQCTFPSTPFAAASINLSLKTECYPHGDWANFALGECVIVYLGDFDVTRVGTLPSGTLGRSSTSCLAQ